MSVAIAGFQQVFGVRIMMKRALRFTDDGDLLRGLALIESDPASTDGSVRPLGNHAVMLADTVFAVLIPRLNAAGIAFTEVAVQPVSQLTPEQQTEIRHRIWNRPASR